MTFLEITESIAKKGLEEQMAPEIIRTMEKVLQLIENHGEIGIFIAFISTILTLLISFSLLKFLWRVVELAPQIILSVWKADS